MALKIKTETDFKRWFRKHWAACGGWSEAYEPRFGGGVGIPDLQVLAHTVNGDTKLYPVELKIGDFVKAFDPHVDPRKVRPDQIGWHRRFRQAGGVSLMIIGVLTDGEFSGAFGIDSSCMDDWEFGYSIKEGFYLDEENLRSSFDLMLRQFGH